MCVCSYNVYTVKVQLLHAAHQPITKQKQNDWEDKDQEVMLEIIFWSSLLTGSVIPSHRKKLKYRSELIERGGTTLDFKIFTFHISGRNDIFLGNHVYVCVWSSLLTGSVITSHSKIETLIRIHWEGVRGWTTLNFDLFILLGAIQNYLHFQLWHNVS